LPGEPRRRRDRWRREHRSEATMYFWIFLFALLAVLLIATVPVWPYSRR
jgi:hypothetical protein